MPASPSPTNGHDDAANGGPATFKAAPTEAAAAAAAAVGGSPPPNDHVHAVKEVVEDAEESDKESEAEAETEVCTRCGRRFHDWIDCRLGLDGYGLNPYTRLNPYTYTAVPHTHSYRPSAGGARSGRCPAAPRRCTWQARRSSWCGTGSRSTTSTMRGRGRIRWWVID